MRPARISRSSRAEFRSKRRLNSIIKSTWHVSAYGASRRATAVEMTSYPGARFDSESWTYGYSFSKELMAEWDWKEHFSPQPDTLEYLNYVADNLRDGYQESRLTPIEFLLRSRQ
jgi:hypothetical protein